MRHPDDGWSSPAVMELVLELSELVREFAVAATEPSAAVRLDPRTVTLVAGLGRLLERYSARIAETARHGAPTPEDLLSTPRALLGTRLQGRAAASEILADLAKGLEDRLPPEVAASLRASIARVRARMLGGSNLPGEEDPTPN